MKFLICAPPYNDKSAGIVVLHELHQEMVNLGIDAHLCIFGNTAVNKMMFTSKTDLQDAVDNGIVIYPEVITGNPLGAKRVVRYFLNKEGAASGNPVHAGANDFILAFSPIYHAKPHAILTKEATNPVFHDRDALPWHERTLDCTYIGKGAFYTQCAVIEQTTEITRSWPESKQELADLLRNTRFVYMYDNMTALITDAIRCGAIPVFLLDYPFTFKEMHGNYYGEVPCGIPAGKEIIVHVEYEQLRRDYLSKIDYVAAQHLEILGGVVEQIKRHFSEFEPNALMEPVQDNLGEKLGQGNGGSNADMTSEKEGQQKGI